MPFQSEKQRRYLWANEPEIARDWTDTYGSKIKKADGGIMRVGLRKGRGVGSDRHPGTGPQGPAGGASAGGNYGGNRNPDQSYGGSGGGGEGARHHTRDDNTEAQQLNRQRQLRDLATRDAQDKLPDIKQRSLLQKMKKKAEGALSNYRKRTVRTIFDDYYQNKPLQFPSALSVFTNRPDWEEEDYLDWSPVGTSLHGDMSDKYLEKMINLQQALRKDHLSQEDLNKFYPTRTLERDQAIPYYPRDVHPGTGGSTTPSTGPTTISEFQESLKNTGGANTPGYYVGEDPLASNVAWGKAYGVDPRTMGMTSFAAHGGRIPAAYGGIMDSSTGRRAYGLGSIFKKIGRAAKKVFKSPIGKAALIGLGGWAANTWGPAQGWFGNMTSGIGKSDIGKKLFMKNTGTKDTPQWDPSWGKIGIGALAAAPFFLDGGDKEKDDKKFDYDAAQNAYRDEIMRIKSGVSAGSLNPNKWSYLPSDYTYTGAKDGGRIGLYAGGQSIPSDYTMEDAMMTTTQDKLGGITDVMKQADLNRKGSVGQFYAAHGGSPNNDKLMARVKELQDEGLDFNSAMAQAMKELSSGNAQGGRIGYAHGSAGYPPVTMGEVPQAPQMPPPVQTPQRPNPMPAPQPNRMAGMNPMGGRRMAQEGGLMDLGGMEKDYRNDGGFVPLGGKEKADDVPARLSKNEFVFTADAVRGAGDGDIDKGAEIMENIMKNLEQGGQISEETQGLSGAQGMFDVSERLSEVV